MAVAYSIVVPAFNEAEELPSTLSAIRKAMEAIDESGECIVVDNNSSDSTSEVARANGADFVVFEPINQIARARNAGAAKASGEFLIFVDADTRILPDLLSDAIALLKTGQCVGGGAVVHFEGEISRIGKFGIGLWEKISRLTQTAAGSYLFCRKDAFDAVGGFDERLYASEEVRMTNQLKKWGKGNGLKFKILTGAPAQTSARKLNWYSGPAILGWVFFMTLFPVAVRWRKLCGFWYNRPVEASK